MWKALKIICSLIKTVPTLSSANLINYLQCNNWKIISSNLNGGQVMLERLRLTERAKSNPAFAVISNELKMVVLRGDLPEKEKCNLLLHEIGHILLGHNLSCLTDSDEIEANQFARQCLVLYKLWNHKGWIVAAGAVLIIFAISAMLYIVPSDACVHCFTGCCQ